MLASFSTLIRVTLDLRVQRLTVRVCHLLACWGNERRQRGGKEVERCSTVQFQPLRTPEPLAPAAHRTWPFHRIAVNIQGDCSKCDWLTCFTVTLVWTFLTLWSSYALLGLLALVTCAFNANTEWALWNSSSPHTKTQMNNKRLESIRRNKNGSR